MAGVHRMERGSLCPAGMGEELALPVGGYPWVGDHDGLQVEAAVPQIAAGERERNGRWWSRVLLPQHVGCGGVGGWTDGQTWMDR